MNEIFSALIFDLDTVVTVVVVVFLMGIYLIPLILVLQDIKSRYKKVTKYYLMFLAIFFLPIFMIMYFIFRQKYTKEEVEESSTEKQINLLYAEALECPRCKNISGNDFNYCSSCGLSLHQACSECSNQIELNWDFCITCGNHLKQNNLDKQEIKIKSDHLIKALGHKIQHLPLD